MVSRRAWLALIFLYCDCPRFHEGLNFALLTGFFWNQWLELFLRIIALDLIDSYIVLSWLNSLRGGWVRVVKIHLGLATISNDCCGDRPEQFEGFANWLLFLNFQKLQRFILPVFNVHSLHRWLGHESLIALAIFLNMFVPGGGMVPSFPESRTNVDVAIESDSKRFRMWCRWLVKLVLWW